MPHKPKTGLGRLHAELLEMGAFKAIVVPRNAFAGMLDFIPETERCRACGGMGTIGDPEETCCVCDGSGRAGRTP